MSWPLPARQQCDGRGFPEEAAKLGTSLTPLGAEKAGNADGTIPEWAGGLKTDAAPLKNGHLTNLFRTNNRSS